MNGDIHDNTLSSVVLMSETSETLGACSHQLRPKPAEIKTKAPFQTREKILSGVITEVLLAFISLFLKGGQKKKNQIFFYHSPSRKNAVSNTKFPQSTAKSSEDSAEYPDASKQKVTSSHLIIFFST